jgi:hypothetical protein
VTVTISKFPLGPKGEAEMVMMPRAEYEVLLERLEDLEDTVDLLKAQAEGEARAYVPGEVVARIIAGEHPVRVWREHRGLTLTQLAHAAGVPQSYVSEIETKKKPGSTRALKRLASVLEVDLDDLVP